MAAKLNQEPIPIMSKRASRPIKGGARDSGSQSMRKFTAISVASLLVFAIMVGVPHNAEAATKIIAFTENSQQNSSKPQILVINETALHVVYQAADDIFMLASIDSGGNFTDPVNISNSGEASSPQIAVSSNDTLFV